MKNEILNLLISKRHPIFIQEVIDQIPSASGMISIYRRVKKNHCVLIGFNCNETFSDAYDELTENDIVDWNPCSGLISNIEAIASGCLPFGFGIITGPDDPILNTNKPCFLPIKLSLKINPKKATDISKRQLFSSIDMPVDEENTLKV